jgi:hypothetical protein
MACHLLPALVSVTGLSSIYIKLPYKHDFVVYCEPNDVLDKALVLLW